MRGVEGGEGRGDEGSGGEGGEKERWGGGGGEAREGRAIKFATINEMQVFLTTS